MRYGVVLVTVVVGLAAAALALLPLVLRHPAQPTYPTLVRQTTTVWAIPVAGGAPRQVVKVDGQFTGPVVSADGRSLLMVKAVGLGESAIWSVPLHGGSPHWVGRAPYFGQLSWSPDRTLFAADDGRAVVIHDLSGHTRVLTRLRGEGGASFPSWGGGNIAFVRMTHPASGWHLDVELWRALGERVLSLPLAYPNGSVVLAPDGHRMALLQVHKLQLLSGHSRRTLAGDASQLLPTWTLDGRSLVYVDTKDELVIQDVATGRRRALARNVGEPAVSPDSRTVYVATAGVKPAVSIPK